MGKVPSIILGLAAALTGLFLLIIWRGYFIFVLKGILPVIFIFAGTIALIAGISEFIDTMRSKAK